MGRNRFVKPEVVKLDLSEGDWIEIKARLNVEELKRVEYAPLSHITADGLTRPGAASVEEAKAEAHVDLGEGTLVAMETYLVDWSFRDGDDKPVKLSRAAIRALDPESADEIMAAIQKYLEARDARKAADPTTATASAKKSA